MSRRGLRALDARGAGRQVRGTGFTSRSISIASNDPASYSHSIINEPSKLLICKHPAAAPQKFTVIFTVKVRSTSIGAGLRATGPEATFRDLSTSIDSRDHRGHRRRRIGVDQGNDQEGPASNALSYCPDSIFRTFFYRHDAARAV